MLEPNAMLPKVRKRIVAKLHIVEMGSFDVDDITLLFIDIRDSLDTLKDFDSSHPLYDIFNFSAHPNMRNKGTTFRYTRDKLKNEILPFIFEGGILGANPINLDIIGSLIFMLNALGIDIDKKKLGKQADKLAKYVYEILKDVPIDVKDEHIETCKVIYDKDLDMPLISFKMKYIEHTNEKRNFTYSGDPTLSFRLF